ncbi:MAG: FHA domain-containing protein [Myxococcota bacterium]
MHRERRSVDAPRVTSVELVIQTPHQPDRIVSLAPGLTRLGRADDNEVVLSDAGVSRRHAQIEVGPNDVTFEDLGSGNGTYQAGRRIQRQSIADGHEYVIDPFVLRFRVHGASTNAGASSATASLQLLGGAGTTFPITAQGLSIGRADERDVVISDPAASRHHGTLSPRGTDYVLRDMGSANGLYVNSTRIRECVLADGDVIRIGNTEMRFSMQSAPRPAPAPSVPRPPPRTPPPSQPAPSQPAIPSRATPKPQGIQATSNAILRVVALLVVGGGTFVSFLIVVGLAVWWYGSSESAIAYTPTPPRWRLDLPNLPSSTTAKLFRQGRDNMTNGDHRAALQDFYRALNRDPSNSDLGKFTFAAGEALVFEKLDTEFSRREEVKSRAIRERDTYLKQLKSKSQRKRRKAWFTLRNKFSTDPLVIKELEEVPEALVKQQQKAAQAQSKVELGEVDEAALMLADLIRETEQPALREQVLASWRQVLEALARETQDVWAEAVRLEASGEKGSAKREFKALALEHAQLPSARAHLERY